MSYKLSNKAEEDIRGIYRYSFFNFGSAQAGAYLTGLEEAILQVSLSPGLAQKADNLGYWGHPRQNLHIAL
jgi:toxin ParE1/3/4